MLGNGRGKAGAKGRGKTRNALQEQEAQKHLPKVKRGEQNLEKLDKAAKASKAHAKPKESTGDQGIENDNQLDDVDGAAANAALREEKTEKPQEVKREKPPTHPIHQPTNPPTHQPTKYPPTHQTDPVGYVDSQIPLVGQAETAAE
jgi:hypothetical protein